MSIARPKKNRKASFDFEVPSENVLSLRKKVWEIKIDPEKLKAFFVHHHKEFVGLFVFLFVVIILAASTSTHANIATFYPSSCLGGWENAKGAEGEPQVKDEDKLENFTADNSAVLKDSTAELFCGGFAGEIPEDTTPKRFSIILSWSVDDGSVVHDQTAPFEQLPVVEEETTSSESEIEVAPVPEGIESQEEAASSTPEENAPVEIPVEQTPIPEPHEEPTPEISPEPQALFPLIRTAYAQEEQEAVDVPNETEPVIVEAEEKPVENDSSHFMELSYTINGKDWKHLAFIDNSDWKKGEFEIIDPELMTWEDTSLLQVSLKPIVSIDTQPVVYVDAIALNMEYGVAVDDVLPQPDFLKDTIYEDITVEHTRAILIVREGEPMIWYTNVQDVEELEEETETTSGEENVTEGENTIPETPPETTEENIISMFTRSAHAQEETSVEAVPVEVLPAPEEQPSEEPVVEPVEETNEDETEPVELTEHTTENEINLDTILPDVPQLIPEQATEQVKESVQVQTGRPVKHYTKKDIEKERMKRLEWTLVARGTVIDVDTTLDISGAKIFWFSPGHKALYEYNTLSSGLSSQTVEENEAEVIYLAPNGDEQVLELDVESGIITTPEENEQVQEVVKEDE